MPWEVSITDTKPMDQLLKTVGEFLFRQILGRADMANMDPKLGGLEIEAKIGTLVDRRNDERLAMPVMTPTVLHEDFSHKHVRFESFMTEVSRPNHPVLMHKHAPK